MVGLEESIFPSGRAVEESGTLEEERRLFYVGVTRAMERLFLCRADSRSFWGRRQYFPPSTFLMEIPSALTESAQAVAKQWKRNEIAARRRGARGESTAAAFAQRSEVDPPLEETPAFPPGSRVRHARLGEGEVLSVTGSGEKRKLSIRFDAGLELEVLERYGGLESVGDLPF
jgi:DNA helicase-2/ATP-dependent DNA helicase PcrA